MGLRFHLGRMLVAAVRETARRLPGIKLPVRFNGEWIWQPSRVWGGPIWPYEPHFARFLDAHLKRGDCFLDVGAGIGIWSCYVASRVAASGRIIACEPSPAYSILQETVKGYPQIESWKGGLSDTTGKEKFYGQGYGMTGSFVEKLTQMNQANLPDVPIESVMVPVLKLDDLIVQYGVQPQVIKIDVEGYEEKVLLGASKTLAQPGVWWVIEVHPTHLKMMGSSEKRVEAILQNHGLKIQCLQGDRSGIHMLAACR